MNSLKGASSASTAPATSSEESESDAEDRDQDVIEDIDVVNMTSNEGRGSTCRILKKKQSDCYSICPYREYRALARQAPRGTITIRTLSSLLEPFGSTGCEIGAAMFELDKDGVGYRCLDDDLEENVRGALGRCTRLTPGDISTVASKLLKQLHDSQNEGASATPMRGALTLLSLKVNCKDGDRVKGVGLISVPFFAASFSISWQCVNSCQYACSTGTNRP